MVVISAGFYENEVNRGSLVCVAVCGVLYSACVCVCVCVLGAAPRQHLWLSGVRVSSGRGRRSPLARYDKKEEEGSRWVLIAIFFPFEREKIALALAHPSELRLLPRALARLRLPHRAPQDMNKTPHRTNSCVLGAVIFLRRDSAPNPPLSLSLSRARSLSLARSRRSLPRVLSS